jgi:hypothetical protein
MQGRVLFELQPYDYCFKIIFCCPYSGDVPVFLERMGFHLREPQVIILPVRTPVVL